MILANLDTRLAEAGYKRLRERKDAEKTPPRPSAADWTRVTVMLKTGKVIVFIPCEADAVPGLDSLLRWSCDRSQASHHSAVPRRTKG